ncbi:hypothetical protein GCM10023169_26950 [Georgenia halophila]|uniref:Lipoprotein n=1 Tax=Georgenia halophila TaxID=620889 RepID=A0ABP8LDL1_9MICO
MICRTIVAAFAVGLALTVAGCAGGEASSTPEPTTAEETTPAAERATPAEATTSTPSPEGASTDGGEPMEEITGAEQNPTEAAPTWDAEAEQAAADRAEAFMRAFARPDLGADEWLAGMAGFMTDQAVELFSYVDPANVPATSLTGEVAIAENQPPTLAEVLVGTDAGTYRVTLSRVAQGDPWMVEYAEPAE